MKSNASTKLLKICGHYRTVLTSYVLTGVKKDGHLSQKAGIATETWRASYKTKAVAIKRFKTIGGHEDYGKIKAVR